MSTHIHLPPFKIKSQLLKRVLLSTGISLLLFIIFIQGNSIQLTAVLHEALQYVIVQKLKIKKQLQMNTKSTYHTTKYSKIYIMLSN